MSGLAEAFVEISPMFTKFDRQITDGLNSSSIREAADKSGETIGSHIGSGVGDGMSKRIRDDRGRLVKTGADAGDSVAGGFDKKMSESSKHLGGVIALGSAAGGLLTEGIAGAFGSIGDLISEARAAESATRITEQVIKTTGGAAHVTAEDIDNLARSISNKTGVDDDAVRSAANLLLTFTGVRNEVGKGNDIFNQATATITDMSVALGQDGKSSAIQLGKALNDPIKGITALSRVGVSFTDQQKAQIAAMVKSGDTMGAQKVILKELGREFGGAAAAASDPMKKLGTTLENTGKQLAVKLLPVFEKVAQWILQSGIPAMQKLGGWIGTNVIPVIQKLAGWISGTLVPAAEGLWNNFMANGLPALKSLWSIIKSNLQPALDSLGKFWTDTLQPALVAAWPVVMKVGQAYLYFEAALVVVESFLIGKLIPVLEFLIGAIIKVIGAVALVVTKLWDWGSAVASVVGTIITDAGKLVTWFQELPGKISSAVSGMWDGIKNEFKAVINDVIGWWDSLSFTTPSISLFGHSTPSVTVHTPHINPIGLASGGIVKARKGGTLAILGEGGSDEAVVPLKGKHGIGGTVVNIHAGAFVVQNADEKQMAHHFNQFTQLLVRELEA